MRSAECDRITSADRCRIQAAKLFRATAVTISNQATLASMKLVTDERGDFTVNGLQAGSYSLLVAKSGLRAWLT
jgi:uncharacterized surface anchored protein